MIPAEEKTVDMQIKYILNLKNNKELIKAHNRLHHEDIEELKDYWKFYDDDETWIYNHFAIDGL